MRLIDELLRELTKLARDYNEELIDKVELNLKIQLLISKIDKLEINFNIQPLEKLVRNRHTKPLMQLLFQSKFKAIQSLLDLKHLDNEYLIVQKLEDIVANKLHFTSLCSKLDNCCHAYTSMNQLKLVPNYSEIFTYYNSKV